MTEITKEGKRKYVTEISRRNLIGVMAKNKKKSHCIRGHVLTPRKTRDGWRVCTTCRKMKLHKAYEKQRALRDSKFPLITSLTGEMR